MVSPADVGQIANLPCFWQVGNLPHVDVLSFEMSPRKMMKLVRSSALVLLASLVLHQNLAGGTDWPAYRGPAQDGISTEKITVQWNGSGPKILWQAPTNTGFSSFAVSEGRVFTQVVREISEISGKPREICLALDASNGKELWFADIARGEGYSGGDTAGGGDGPRSTPTVSDGKVYLLTPDLVVHCLNAENGKQIWTRNLMRENHGRNISWNSAASVAVDGNLVFVGGGGAGESMLGLDKLTGNVVWKTGDERITHSTPVVATILDQRQVIFFMQSGLVSLDTKTGRQLWKFPFRFNVSTAISPVVSGDIVYLSAGYDVGSAACRIEKQGDDFVANKLWFSRGNEPVVNHWSTPVCKDGYLYGMFGFKKFKKGPMKCVELATGKVMWQQPGFGQGNVILVGNRLVALAEDGNLVIVEAAPAAYKEIARTRAFTDKCWTTPAFSDGKIFVRSISQGTCFDVSGK
jgi:outer membrane protein assembly factor BamB